MGTVSRAFDRELGVEVALKSVRVASPQAFYQLKAEFRAIADIRHRNLVRLGELFGGEDEWFFSMELVEGLDFLHWVRGVSTSGNVYDTAVSPRRRADESKTEQSPSPFGGSVAGADRAAGKEDTLPKTARKPKDAAPPRFHEARLREVLRQVGAGLEVLHRAGRVHRDMKPSNVVVEADSGRVVILDFGLTREASVGSTDSGRRVEGTAGYMAPEQARGEPLDAAADWYAVGVMLYEALTGRLPFDGRPLEVLAKKVAEDPPPPSTHTLGIPHDLERACLSLLARDPRERGGAEVIRELAGSPAPRSSGTLVLPDEGPFVGRAAELAELRRAFDDGRRGRPVMARVIGESGVGKTTLVRRFLSDVLDAEPNAVVLEGRCYAHELVPYKAWDGIVDAISRWLRRIETEEGAAHAAWLVPKDVHALAQVFPVLRRVPAIAELVFKERIEAGPTTPERTRRLAFDALRELLRNLGSDGPLLLWVDDFHWADRDSRILLEDLLTSSETASMLLVTTERPSELELPSIARTIALATLREEEAIALATALNAQRSSRASQAPPALEGIARESGGHPMFLQQLLRSGPRDGKAPALDAVLLERVGALEPKARRLLEVVCVSVAPLALGVASRASGLTPGSGEEARALLEGEQLLRPAPGDATRFEPFHDRIRETVLSALAPDAHARHHAALAEALDAGDDADTDRHRVWHLSEAGQRDGAARAAEAAARRAEAALAFDRAADLYRMALHLGQHTPEEHLALQLRLSESLANAGRGAVEAAQGFLAAADAHDDPDVALSLRTRALEQLAMSGNTEQAMELLRRLCDDVGVGLAKGRLGALASLVRRRLQIRWRGLPASLPPHSGTEAAESPAYRMYLAAFVHLPILDPLLANELHSRTLTDALRSGELETLGLCLCREAGVSLTFNERRVAHAQRAIRLGRQVFALSEHPGHHAWISVGEGLQRYFLGQFDGCLPYFRDALEIWSDDSGDHVMNVSQMTVFIMGALRYMGRLGDLRRELDRARRDAEWRGNRYLWTLSTVAFQLPILLQDGLDASRRDMARLDLSMPLVQTQANEWYLRRTQAEEALYRGAGGEELARLGVLLRAFLYTPYGMVVTWGSELRWLLGRLALARADAGDTRALRETKNMIRRLRRRQLPYCKVWADALTAAVKLHAGDLHGCRVALEECAVRAELGGQLLVAAAARLRLVELGFAGDETRREALAFMESERVRDVSATVQLMMPGFRPPRRLASGAAPALPG